jgi:hypothetical protein
MKRSESEMSNFQTVSRISPEEEETWRQKIVLTIDLDWCNDDVLEYTIQIIEEAKVKATWFVTHPTKHLDFLRKQGHELGIHPNFNRLLDGSARTGSSARSILDSCLEAVPSATAVRSHSLVQSERLLDLFAENGLTHVCNAFVPLSAKSPIKPFRLWGDLVVVPHNWQDNTAIRIKDAAPSEEYHRGQFVVADFHPIHVFLNSDSMERYEQSRPQHSNPGGLGPYRNELFGTHDVLLDLLGLAEFS